ncbi:hypothetical protein [Streptomyces sp. NPDC001774]
MSLPRRLTATGTALLLSASIATAAASTAASATPNALTAAGQHCAVLIPSGAQQCFSGFREAVAFGTKGRVTDAPLDAIDAAQSSKFAVQINETGSTEGEGSRVLIGVFFEDVSYSGDSISFYGGNGPCDDSDSVAEYSWSDVGDSWNDRISAFRGFNNCWVRGYEHTNFGGSALSRHHYDSNLINDRPGPGADGSWNDVISSVKFF